ncbi:MAG: hypothetical protein ABR616_05600 [Dermatophilaceae bacterium]
MTDHLPVRAPQPAPPARAAAPLNSIVAAARKISGARMKRAAAEGWQDEAWDLYDEVGELRFVANQHANAVSRAKLFAAHVPFGDEEPVPIERDHDETSADAETVAAVVGSMAGGMVGRSELLRRLALQMFVPGDGYLVGLPDGVLDVAAPTDDDRPADTLGPEGAPTVDSLVWHALSVSEVSSRGSTIVLSIGDARREIDADNVVLIRVWRPHPRRWWAADSPVRANLPVLRELVGLTKHVGASIDSRLAGAGLLVLGQSVSVVTPAAEDDPDGTDEEPPSFVDALIETMTIPIKDRDSAAAVVPLTIQVPDDVVDKIQHITFETPFDKEAKELRDEAIRRLALGLDAPPEALLGMGGTNHWSAWQIEESSVKIHIEPVLALICDALTTQYLWPVLEEANVADARSYVVWFDTADLTLRPNRSAEAAAAFDRGQLSGEALRRHSGFDDADAPEQDDVDPIVARALDLVAQAPSLISNPGLPAIVAAIREVMSGDGTATPDVLDDVDDADDPDSGMEIPDRAGPDPDLAASLVVANGRPYRG